MYFAYLRIKWRTPRETLKIMEQEVCMEAEGLSSFEELPLGSGSVRTSECKGPAFILEDFSPSHQNMKEGCGFKQFEPIPDKVFFFFFLIFLTFIHF